MVWGLLLGGAKRLLGGGRKKSAAKADIGPNKGQELQGDAARTAKELLTPIRKNGKRNGKRKSTRNGNGSRSRGRSGGR